MTDPWTRRSPSCRRKNFSRSCRRRSRSRSVVLLLVKRKRDWSCDWWWLDVWEKLLFEIQTFHRLCGCLKGIFILLKRFIVCFIGLLFINIIIVVIIIILWWCNVVVNTVIIKLIIININVTLIVQHLIDLQLLKENDAHKMMVARLDWELKERKALVSLSDPHRRRLSISRQR